ncbi:MAG: response regulator, partial [Candidatus Cloacimonetes bacterium]|nr:response regulator [Candidatus Cloacimonadota bacterium]
MNQMIKVLVVDDTVIYRKILKDVVSEIDNTEVIGTAPNGDLALRKMEVDKPDLVLLDVEMPVKDGLETLVEIKAKYPEIGVIMVSGINERQASITMEALQKGAIDFVPKPIGNNIEANIQSLKNSLIPIISLFQTKKAISGAKSGRSTESS